MSIFTRKTIYVPVEMCEVVYVNIEGLPFPAKRVITEIRVAQNGIFITGTNSRTGEKTVWQAADVDKKFFVDIHAAEAAARQKQKETVV